MSEKIAKILVVEDENAVRESYIDMFEFFGYEVDSAPNGREGVVKVTNKDYDIVITDLNMPEMDGIEVLKRIMETHPEQIVIMMTALGSIEIAVDAMKHGAFHYISKPFKIAPTL